MRARSRPARHGLPEDTWWHLAIVNDGKHTVIYVEGCPTVDNRPLSTREFMIAG